MQIMTYARTP